MLHPAGSPILRPISTWRSISKSDLRGAGQSYICRVCRVQCLASEKRNMQAPSPANIDDPYLWLEDVEGARAVAWVEAENARTLAALAGPEVEPDRAALPALPPAPRQNPCPRQPRGFFY